MKTNKIKIGIHAADLCHDRIDGTRIYLMNMLKRFGTLEPNTRFHIYLKGKINPQLSFQIYPNYTLHESSFPFYWTQLKLPAFLKKTKPQVLWMPMHNLPRWRPRGIKTVITIHDLAFKMFPNLFPKKDLKLLNRLTDYAVKKADRIIAVSRSTQKDICQIYGIDPAKVRVIYHGYDKHIFHLPSQAQKNNVPAVKKKYQIPDNAPYIIYVGALQPRKNLGILVNAFERLKTIQYFSKFKLVLAGGEAWMTDDLKAQINISPQRENIILTGGFHTNDLPYLLWGSRAFVFPSLYEGFGIPIIEAMACGVPVVSAKNSSLTEVGGNACQYFDSKNSQDLAFKLREIFLNKGKKKKMIESGLERVKNFSWDKTARETYEYLEEIAQNR